MPTPDERAAETVERGQRQPPLTTANPVFEHSATQQGQRCNQPVAAMNLQLPGRPGAGPLVASVPSGHDSLAWGTSPASTYLLDRCGFPAVDVHTWNASSTVGPVCCKLMKALHRYRAMSELDQTFVLCACADRAPRSNADQFGTPTASAAGDRPHATSTNGHTRRDRHVSWMGQDAAEPSSNSTAADQQQAASWQDVSLHPATLQSPSYPLPIVSTVMVPVAAAALLPAAAAALRLQDSGSPARQPAIGDVPASAGHHQSADDQQQQPAQPAAAQLQPGQPAGDAAAPQPQRQPAPAGPQPAGRKAAKSEQRAATPGVARRWVRPKPAQSRGWNDSTQSMGTVLRRKLPPVPPPVRTSTVCAIGIACAQTMAVQ